MPVAQWLEHNAYNVDVGSSILPWRTMTYQEKYIITAEDEGKRLDLFLTEITGLSRSKIQKDIKSGIVLINGVLTQKVGKVLRDEQIITFADAPEVIAEVRIVPQEVIDSIEIIADEEDYLIVNKPSGILVHPTQANEPVTLASELLKKYPEIAGVGESDVRPGIVHRLDKDASGLLVIAKNQKMFNHLKAQFKNRTIQKEYGVLVHGFIDKEYDLINFDIDRGTDGKMVSRPYVKELTLDTIKDIQDGKEALTEIWIEEHLVRYSLLRVKIHTGRTHQIRVHLYAYNHPVLGDKLYLNKKLNRNRDRALGRIFLHAQKLGFKDLSGNDVMFESKLPKVLQEFLDELKK